MGACGAVKAIKANGVIATGEKIKEFNDRNISYSALLRKAQKLAGRMDVSLCSLSTAGNPLPVNNEETWDYLRLAKNKEILVLIVKPEDCLRNFDVTPTFNKAIDHENQVIKRNLADFVDFIEIFDTHFKEFVVSMSYFYVRGFNLQIIILVFIVLLAPYTDKITLTMPYINVTEEMRPSLPSEIASILTKWEILMEDIKDLDYQIDVLNNNIDCLTSNNLKRHLAINRGKVLNQISLKRAENNLKLYKANEELKEIMVGLEKFKETLKVAFNTYVDGRVKITNKLNLFIRKVGSKEPQEIAWTFGMGDYSSSTGGYRFL